MSFRLKTILGIAIIELFLVALLTISSSRELYSKGERDLMDNAQATANTLALLSKDAVISSDLATLQDYVNNAYAANSLSGLRIVGESGEVLASRGSFPEASPPQDFVADTDLQSAQSDVFRSSAEVQESGYAFATVQLTAPTAALDQLLAETLRRAFSIGLVGVMLSALFSYILGTYLTNRLRQIRNAAREITSGTYTVQINAEGSDELALTAKAFNTMSQHLQRTISDLEQQRQAADAANSSKSLFLANMSHEIRTPLNAIVGITSLMERENLPEDTAEKIKKIKVSSDALMAQVNDILDFSKIEAGEFTLDPSPASLTEVITEIASVYEDIVHEKALELTYQIEPLVSEYYLMDRHRLKQVLLNLVSNALKFTHSGKIHISAHIEDRATSTDMLVIAVADTGIGIDAEKVPQLFQAFTQEDASTSRRYGGTGLGLTICKQIVELMGGTIHVVSSKGRGSKFFITLPLKPVGASCTLPTHSGDTAGIAGIHLLVVEDNRMNRDLMSMLLESEEVQFTMAENGAIAVELFQQNRSFDAVLMDFQMPVMDGFAATAAIREWEKQQNLPPTPIIAMTANALSADKERSSQVGMDDYLTKPVHMDTMRSTLKQWVRPSATKSSTNNYLAPESQSLASPETPEPSTEPNQVLDPKVLGDLRMLSTGKNSGFFEDCLSRYVETGNQESREVEELLGKEDFASLAQTAHRWKTSSGIIGATAVTAGCQSLEAACRQETVDKDFVGRVCRELNSAHQEAVAAAQQLLKQEEVASAS